MSPASFALEIGTQGWLDRSLADSPTDLCSHGTVRVEIGGRVIAAGDGGEYTISTSALALLRTLESDHSPEGRVADRLILHCGMLEMLTCPIGIDWSVRHERGRVHLSEVVRYDGVDEAQAVRFPEAEADLPEGEYRRHIVEFAGVRSSRSRAPRRRRSTSASERSTSASGASTTHVSRARSARATRCCA